MKTAIALFCILALFLPGADAKRNRNPSVAPISVKGIIFRISTQADERGLDVWLTATGTGRNPDKPFKKLVYRISFDPRMETDVQAVYPVSMKARSGFIRIMDERGNIHKVSLLEITGTGTGNSN